MPPIDVILDVLYTTILPSLAASFVAGWLLRQTQYIVVASLVGLLAGNLASGLLPWWPSQQEMSVLLLIQFFSFFLMGLSTRQWLTGSVFIVILSSIVVQQESQSLFTHTAYVLVGVTLYLSLFAAERCLSGRILLLLGTLSGLACSIILLYAHSGMLCQIALLWMSSCGGLALVLLRSSLPIQGIAGPATIFLQYLLFYGQQTCFSEVPVASFILAASAPLSGLLLYLNFHSPRIRLIAIAGWLLLLVAATGLAVYYDDVLIVK